MRFIPDCMRVLRRFRPTTFSVSWMMSVSRSQWLLRHPSIDSPMRFCIFFPAVMPPVTTVICGPKCSLLTLTIDSNKKVFSIPPRVGLFCSISWRPEALRSPWMSSGLSGVESRLLMHFSDTGDSIPDAVFCSWSRPVRLSIPGFWYRSRAPAPPMELSLEPRHLD